MSSHSAASLHDFSLALAIPGAPSAEDFFNLLAMIAIANQQPLLRQYRLLHNPELRVQTPNFFSSFLSSSIILSFPFQSLDLPDLKPLSMNIELMNSDAHTAQLELASFGLNKKDFSIIEYPMPVTSLVLFNSRGGSWMDPDTGSVLADFVGKPRVEILEDFNSDSDSSGSYSSDSSSSVSLD